MSTSQNIKTLQDYRDKSYVLSILYERHSGFYNFIKNIINIPLILISSSMSIINSNFEPQELKIINIIVNCIVALLLSMMNNFKIDIKAQTFHNLSMKMNRLCHKIENELTDNIDDISPDAIVNYINEYDNLNETLEFGLIDYINNKVKLIYKDIKTLPNCLNCTSTFTAPGGQVAEAAIVPQIVIQNEIISNGI